MNKYYDPRNPEYYAVFLCPADFAYYDYKEPVPDHESLNEFTQRTQRHQQLISRKAQEVINRNEIEVYYHKFFHAGVPRWFIERDERGDYASVLAELVDDAELQIFLQNLVRMMIGSWSWRFHFRRPELLNADTASARAHIRSVELALKRQENLAIDMSHHLLENDLERVEWRYLSKVDATNDLHELEQLQQQQQQQQEHTWEEKDSQEEQSEPAEPAGPHPSPMNEQSQGSESSGSGDSCRCMATCQARNLLKQAKEAIKEVQDLVTRARMVESCASTL